MCAVSDDVMLCPQVSVFWHQTRGPVRHLAASSSSTPRLVGARYLGTEDAKAMRTDLTTLPAVRDLVAPVVSSGYVQTHYISGESVELTALLACLLACLL